VKVLDFGLAKAVEAPGEASPDMANSPTLTARATQMGVILGTAAYMAPEQAKGAHVDKRADVWAFGVVLFEMLSGRRPFEGDDVTEVMAGVIKQEPDWSLLPADLPVALERLLRRCLVKQRANRLRDIGDARLEIDDAGARVPAVQAPTAAARIGRRELLAWGTALLAVAAMVVLWSAGRPATSGAPVSFQLSELEDGRSFDMATDLVLSPDGQHVAFSATATGTTTSSIWVRSIPSGSLRRLDSTDGGSQPFWSPDSRTLAFAADGQLKKIDITGDLAQTIAPMAPSAGGTWGRDDVIVFAGATHLYRVRASGGDPVPITSDADIASTGPHRWPSFLPDGRRYLTVTVNAGDVFVSSLDSDERTQLFQSSSKVLQAGPDHLLFVRQGVLLAQPFDFSRGVASGETMPIAEDLRTSSFTGNAEGGAADFTASVNGTVLYRPASVPGGGQPDTVLAWFDRLGTRQETIGSPGQHQGVALSPDGRSIAYHVHTSEGGDIVVRSLTSGRESQVTSSPAEHNASPFWIDGERLGFAKLAGLAGRGRELFFARVPPQGAEPEHITALDGGSQASAYGEVVLFENEEALWTVQLGETEASRQVASGANGQFSPDGRWIVYESSVSGLRQVYILPYPSGDAVPVPVSVDGGRKPRWSWNGREVFYLAGDRTSITLMAAAVDTVDGRVEVDPPEELFPVDLACATCLYFPYAVAPDDRFLMTMPAEPAIRLPATVVVNWPASVWVR
jgi:Tol biopolymer transport system component